MRKNGSNILPYIVAGSAIGGTIGYLFMTKSGRRIRESITNPRELSDKLEDARDFLERRARRVTDRMRDVLDKAKEGMESGQRAYREAGEKYRTHFGTIEGKNNEIASSIHKTVDNLNKAAYSIEQTILDPLYEVRALYRGFSRGIRSFLGRQGQVSQFQKTEWGAR